MRLKFYVSGSKRKGNATIDLKKVKGLGGKIHILYV